MSSLVPDDAPNPWLCHVKKWSDFNGYGFNLHAEKGKAGQFIGKVDDNSPAEAAGLREGDRIVEVNGTNIGNENHQQVAQRIKAVPNETELLVVDPATDQYYKERKIVVRGDMPNVKKITCPDTSLTAKSKNLVGGDGTVAECPSKPRQCLVKIWPDFCGFGFNVHAEKGEFGQFIGKVDEGSPADLAGLREGDRIVEVNDQSIAQDNHQQVVQKIMQDPNKAKLLVVDKEGDKYYRENSIPITSSLPDVLFITCPDSKPIERVSRNTTDNSNTYRSKPNRTSHQVRGGTFGGGVMALGPEMQQLYHDVCRKGTRKVYQTRLMIIGHFAAGKTSVKRSLLDEGLIKEHITTDGLDKLEETVMVDVETAVNWRKVNLNPKDEFATEAAKQLFAQINSKAGEPDKRQVPDEAIRLEHSSEEGRIFYGLPSKVGPNGQESLKEFPKEAVKFDSVKDVVLAKLGIREEEGHQVQLTIWDFGGQHVYYTSHQTFLTHRAIYLLVMDITKALGDVIEEYRRPLEHIGLPRTAMDFLNFWLNSVHTHLIERELSSDQYDPPVIIVLTKTDTLDKDARRKAFMIQEFIQDIDHHLRGKPYYGHVRDIIPVSNLDTSDQGINILRCKILEEAEQQAYWGEERPTKWLLLANELKEQVSLVEPVVNLRQVHQAAQECGVPQNEVQTFLRFHHNLGDIVYFDEPETKDTVILSPQWLASQFSKVITQEKFLRERNISSDQTDFLRRGILSNTTAAKLCGTTQPKALVKIMEKFDMLVPCHIKSQQEKEEEAHLVPCLLPRVTYQTAQEEAFPKIQFKFVSKTTRYLAYLTARGFVPHGLYHRLVSQCCRVREWSYHKAMIFYDYMTIDVNGFYISLHMVNNGITLSAFKFEGKPVDHREKLSVVRHRIQSMIEEISIDVFPNLRCVLCLECNCFVVYEPRSNQSFAARHAMTTQGYIPVLESEGGLNSSVFCDHHGMIIDTAPWDIWFGKTLSTQGPSFFPCGEGEISAEGKKLQAELLSHSQILKATPDCIHDKLVGAAFLSFDDVVRIKTEDTSKMFQMLVSRVNTPQDRQAAKDAVCRGLCESSQYCPFSNKEEPATKDQLLRLHRLFPRLIEDMDVTPVLDRLFQSGIADSHTRDLVRAEKTRRGRVYQLLKFMEHAHKRAQDQFIDILKNTNWWIFGDDPPAESMRV